jgi:cytochrome c oxidase cbb3-type subunit 4
MDLQEVHSTASVLWVIWFFVLFGGIVVWACWPGKRKTFKAAAEIPLRDDE